MDDKKIVSLFWDRDENAIKVLQSKYGRDFIKLSCRVLNNVQDAEECVNDAYLKVWDSIPDARPDYLFSYVAKIVRNLSINLLKKNTAGKRGGGDLDILLSEMEECIADKDTVENYVESKELSILINEYLHSVKTEQRTMFVQRYWYAERIKEIAKTHNCSSKKVESVLFRTRKSLKEFLQERGYFYE